MTLEWALAWAAVAVLALGGAAVFAAAVYVEHLQREIDEHDQRLGGGR